MSSEDYSVIALAETTKSFVKSVRAEEPSSSRYSKKKYRKPTTENGKEKGAKRNALRRLPSFSSPLIPNFSKFRNGFRKLNCFKSEKEEEMPIMEVPRHKSIDIGVGLARRVSLFLFTRRTVCVHPYHPFTPEQTTRKIYFCSEANSKTFDICELVMELENQGFARSQLKDWMCLIEAESSRRTDVVGGPDEDGSYDYGIFQINDRYWCGNIASPAKGCNLECKDFLSDDITRASECAKKIYKQQGFGAWVGWKNECKGKILEKPNC